LRLTLISDDYSEIDSDDIPANTDGVILPDTEVDMTSNPGEVPEPSPATC